MKICTKCKTGKELSFFSKDKSRKDGHSFVCKKCSKEYNSKYYNKNKNKILNNAKEYGYENKDKKREYDKEYREQNRDKIIARQKIWSDSNREQRAKYKKEYYQNNKDDILEKNKLYRMKNAKDIAKRRKIYQDKNKDNLSKYYKYYKSTDKGKAVKRNSNHKRRQVEKIGDVTSEQMLELMKIKICYWCGCSLKNKNAHIDHYIPLSKGGKHTISNLVVSCVSCNLRKNAKDPMEFALEVGKLL